MNVIDKAIDKIRRDGWWQGGDDMPTLESTCVVLSISRTTEDWAEREAAYEAIRSELGLGIGDGRERLTPIYRFNDDPSTTEEDVLLLMKKASARLDEQAAS